MIHLKGKAATFFRKSALTVSEADSFAIPQKTDLEIN